MGTNPLRQILLVCLVLLVGPLGAQIPPESVVVVLASPHDPRLPFIDQAIAFWNRELVALGLPPAFGELRAMEPATRRALETYARRTAQRAGRDRLAAISVANEPVPPLELQGIDEPVVVLLSMQDLMPFAWPLPQGRADAVMPSTSVVEAGTASPVVSPDTHSQATGFSRRSKRYFIALPLRDEPTPESFVNIVAHEFGHTLGLRHQRGTETLMCMPCGAISLTGRVAAETTNLRALSPSDRVRLREVYGTGESSGDPHSEATSPPNPR